MEDRDLAQPMQADIPSLRDKLERKLRAAKLLR